MAVEPDKITKLYNDTIEIGFWENRHRYSLREKDGKWSRKFLISSTGATSMIDKSAPLMNWAVRVMGEFLIKNYGKGIRINPKMIEIGKLQHSKLKKKAADLGTTVHDWCELYVKTKPSKRKDILLPVEEKAVNGVIAFLKWFKEYDVEPIEAERMVYSKKHRFVGLMDLKAKVNGQLACVDYKTSNNVYNEHRYQTSAYAAADEEETGIKYDIRWILNFCKETGGFKAYKLEDRKEFEKDYKCFLGALEVKKRSKELYNNRLEPEC